MCVQKEGWEDMNMLFVAEGLTEVAKKIVAVSSDVAASSADQGTLDYARVVGTLAERLEFLSHRLVELSPGNDEIQQHLPW